MCLWFQCNRSNSRPRFWHSEWDFSNSCCRCPKFPILTPSCITYSYSFFHDHDHSLSFLRLFISWWWWHSFPIFFDLVVGYFFWFDNDLLSIVHARIYCTMVSIYASVLGQRFVCHIGWMPGWSSTTLVFAIHHICILHGTGFWLHYIAFYQLWLWPTPNVAQKWWQQHENDDVKDNKKIWSYWWWTSTIRLAISHRSRIGTDVLRAFKW